MLDVACCDTERALESNCDRMGICPCKPNFSGPRCESCATGYFGPKCEHKVRISPGTVHDNQGYVEVLSPSAWNGLAKWRPYSGHPSHWNHQRADLVCKTLGFKSGLKGWSRTHCRHTYPYMAPCYNQYKPPYVNCGSSATSLSECSIATYNNNGYAAFATIECTKNI